MQKRIVTVQGSLEVLFHTSRTESDKTFTEMLKGINPSDRHQKPGIESIAISFMGKRRPVCIRLRSWILEQRQQHQRVPTPQNETIVRLPALPLMLSMLILPSLQMILYYK